MYKFAAGMLTALGILAGVVLLASCGTDDGPKAIPTTYEEWGRKLDEGAAELPACEDIWAIGKVLDLKSGDCRMPDGERLLALYDTDSAIAVYEDPTTKLTRWAGVGTGWKIVEQDPKYGADYNKDPAYRRAMTKP